MINNTCATVSTFDTEMGILPTVVDFDHLEDGADALLNHAEYALFQAQNAIREYIEYIARADAATRIKPEGYYEEPEDCSEDIALYTGKVGVYGIDSMVQSIMWDIENKVGRANLMPDIK